MDTHYKDCEVRSFSITNANSVDSQIWIEYPDRGEGWVVRAWDYKKQSAIYRCNEPNLFETLDETIKQVQLWR